MAFGSSGWLKATGRDASKAVCERVRNPAPLARAGTFRDVSLRDRRSTSATCCGFHVRRSATAKEEAKAKAKREMELVRGGERERINRRKDEREQKAKAKKEEKQKDSRRKMK